MKRLFKFLVIVILVVIFFAGCQVSYIDDVNNNVNNNTEEITRTPENTNTPIKSTAVVSGKNEIEICNDDVIGSYTLCIFKDINKELLMVKEEIWSSLLFQATPNFALLEDGTVTRIISFACLYGKWYIDKNNVVIESDNGIIETYIYEDGYLYRKVKAEEYTMHLSPNPIDPNITELLEYYKKSELSKWNYIDENNY